MFLRNYIQVVDILEIMFAPVPLDQARAFSEDIFEREMKVRLV